MLTKAERTQQRILDEAAKLFNRKGYAGTHIRDIMDATGLAKGGIYGNFENKEELELAAFDHGTEIMTRALRDVFASQTTAPGKLHALLRFYERFVNDPPVAGGCIIMNTSIEADDAHPALRQRVVTALDGWQRAVARIITDGKKRGEIRSSVSAAEYAALIFATISGGIMMAKAYGDQGKLRIALKHLHAVVDNELSATGG